MSRHKSSLLAELALSSAVAGFGFSGGRSSWRWLERRSKTLIPALLIIAGTGLAVFYLRTSEHEGVFRRLFMVWIPAFALALISLFACFAFGGLMGSRELIKILLIWQCITFVTGLALAQPIRNRRRRAQTIHIQNEAFLQSAGLKAVGGQYGTMIDEHGRELVLDDVRSDAIIFRVKGRRAVRSKILLDGSGRMIGYEPV